MSSTRIEGFVDIAATHYGADIEWTKLFTHEQTFPCHHAVTIISTDGTPPRVMTLEEHQEKVKAMLMELVDASEFGSDARWRVKLMHIHNLAAKHGIQLGPSPY